MKKKMISLLLTLLLCVMSVPYLVNAAENDTAEQKSAEPGMAGSQSLKINEQNFPDAAFRKYLMSLDTDGNGYIDPDTVTEMDTYNIYAQGFGDVKDLTGIEYFTQLTKLSCYQSSLTKLDVSKNKKLAYLDVNYDSLEYLDITGLQFPDSPDVPLWGGLWLHIQNTNGVVDLSKIKGLDFNLIKEKDFDVTTKKLYLGNVFSDVDKNHYCLTESNLPFEFYIELMQPTISYRTHVQSYGWQDYVSNGRMAGTTGEAKRLEAIEIDLLGTGGTGIRYTTHVQSYGWLPWTSNGEMSGTEGEAKRLEAIKIEIDDKSFEQYYDVYYRVHAESYGWLGWAKNGEPAGTAGYGKRLEGIQILVVKKGEKINEKMEGITSARTEAYIAKEGSSPVVGAPSTSAVNPFIPGEETMNVSYRTHVQTYGWQGWKYNGQMAGTTGEGKRLEGINIRLTNQRWKYPEARITYRTHVQSIGWMPWVSDGEMSGTKGQAKRLEAIEIKLESTDNGALYKDYDIYYRVHAQSYGWLGWAKNGEPAGTSGLAKRLEGIQIVLVPKGSAAPSNSYGGITSANGQAYIAK